MNTSGVKPAGNMLLVLPDVVEERTQSGIYLGTDKDIERIQLGQTEGVVMSFGPDAYRDSSRRCKLGDRVIFKKYSGIIIKGKDEKSYRLIDDQDVGAVFE